MGDQNLPTGSTNTSSEFTGQFSKAVIEEPKQEVKETPVRELVTIRRYQNRKLYNTQTSTYITMSEIADLLFNNSDVKVIDNVTGEDITTYTLVASAAEKSKKLSNEEITNLLSLVSNLIQTKES
jgi:polyhydroxyalkanoate synthesis repressor PhaR